MDPVIDSVTKVFYDRGWHGIDIEPHPAYAAVLRSARARDVVEGTAADDAKGSVALHLIATGDGDDTGLSTTVERHARRHATDGMSIRTVDVRTAPLTELLAGTEAEDPGGFHFLKDRRGGSGRRRCSAGLTSTDSGRWWSCSKRANRTARPMRNGAAEDLLLRRPIASRPTTGSTGGTCGRMRPRWSTSSRPRSTRSRTAALVDGPTSSGRTS
jgi:methyltransferase FkbM-like protein